jgi:hypothetical protein
MDSNEKCHQEEGAEYVYQLRKRFGNGHRIVLSGKVVILDETWDYHNIAIRSIIRELSWEFPTEKALVFHKNEQPKKDDVVVARYKLSESSTLWPNVMFDFQWESRDWERLPCEEFKNTTFSASMDVIMVALESVRPKDKCLYFLNDSIVVFR